MKRKLLTLISFVSLLCIFLAISVMAEDNVPEVTDSYYLVNSTESDAYGKLTAAGAQVVCYSDIIGDTTGSQPAVFFGSFAEDSHIEIIFAEDIYVTEDVAQNNVGILISTKITVTFNYNGFGHYIACATDAGANGIVVRHKEAMVRLIGTKGIDLENGGVSNVFTEPSYNSENGTFNVDGCSLDIYKTNGHYVQIYKGKAYIEGVRGKSASSVILTDSEAVGPYDVINSAFTANNDYALQFKATLSKTLRIENSYTKGLEAYSVVSGSYVKNSTIEGKTLHIDSWHDPGHVWEFINCDVLVSRISSSTGRTYYCFTDCTFKENLSWGLSGDNGGNQYVRIYTSATCETPGSLVLKQSTNKGNGRGPFAEEYDNYSAPALGHTGTAEWAYNYTGDKYLSELTISKGCTRCGLWDPQSVYVGTMFQTLGYSVSQFGTNPSIIAGFYIDKDAIARYEEISGAKIRFGCAVALKDMIGEGVNPLDENGNAIVLENGKVLTADITSAKNSYMDIKVTLTNDHLDTALLITGYILEKSEDSVTISYMQSNNTLVKDSAFEYISYNNN